METPTDLLSVNSWRDVASNLEKTLNNTLDIERKLAQSMHSRLRPLEQSREMWKSRALLLSKELSSLEVSANWYKSLFEASTALNQFNLAAEKGDVRERTLIEAEVAELRKALESCEKIRASELSRHSDELKACHDKFASDSTEACKRIEELTAANSQLDERATSLAASVARLEALNASLEEQLFRLRASADLDEEGWHALLSETAFKQRDEEVTRLAKRPRLEGASDTRTSELEGGAADQFVDRLFGSGGGVDSSEVASLRAQLLDRVAAQEHLWELVKLSESVAREAAQSAKVVEERRGEVERELREAREEIAQLTSAAHMASVQQLQSEKEALLASQAALQKDIQGHLKTELTLKQEAAALQQQLATQLSTRAAQQSLIAVLESRCEAEVERAKSEARCREESLVNEVAALRAQLEEAEGRLRDAETKRAEALQATARALAVASKE